MAIFGLLVCSCTTRTRTAADLKSPVSAIRQYVDSFEGLSMEEVRARFSDVQLTEEEWREGGFVGRQLVATFPEYEVRVLFSGNEVITTSFQVLSE
jgi:hypothetical protein